MQQQFGFDPEVETAMLAGARIVDEESVKPIRRRTTTCDDDETKAIPSEQRNAEEDHVQLYAATVVASPVTVLQELARIKQSTENV